VRAEGLDPEIVDCEYVVSNFFPLLGAAAALGRLRSVPQTTPPPRPLPPWPSSAGPTGKAGSIRSAPE
jgi:hypothetical protein